MFNPASYTLNHIRELSNRNNKTTSHNLDTKQKYCSKKVNLILWCIASLVSASVDGAQIYNMAKDKQYRSGINWFLTVFFTFLSLMMLYKVIKNSCLLWNESRSKGTPIEEGILLVTKKPSYNSNTSKQ